MIKQSLIRQGLLTAFVFCIAVVQALACSCRPPAPITQEEFFEADMVFVGKIISMEEDAASSRKTATFKIINHIKVPGGIDEITIVTPYSSASCGLTFEEGATWYIWGTNEGDYYSSNICTRSIRLNDQGTSTTPRFNEDMEAIERFKSQTGTQTFEVANGKAEGKLKNGLKKGWWKYYDGQGTLYKKVCYKKGVQKKEKILAEPVMSPSNM